MKRSSLSYLISAGALLAALAPVASHAQAAWDGQIRFTGSAGAAQTETRGAAIEFDQGSANINGATGNLMVTGFQPAKGVEIGIWNAGNGKTNKLDLRGTCLRATYRRFS